MRLLREIWGRFSLREQQVVVWGALLSAGLLGYMLVVGPAMERMTLLRDLIPQKRKDLEALQQLQHQYIEMDRRVSAIDRQLQTTGADFSLLAFVESTVMGRVGKAHLASIRPQPTLPFEQYEEIAVEIKLERVSLAQIVAFLDALEQAPQRVRTKRLEIKSRFDKEEQLDATIVVAVYQLAQRQPTA